MIPMIPSTTHISTSKMTALKKVTVLADLQKSPKFLSTTYPNDICQYLVGRTSGDVTGMIRFLTRSISFTTTGHTRNYNLTSRTSIIFVPFSLISFFLLSSNGTFKHHHERMITPSTSHHGKWRMVLLKIDVFEKSYRFVPP